jgi:hypothetical protein
MRSAAASPLTPDPSPSHEGEGRFVVRIAEAMRTKY